MHHGHRQTRKRGDRKKHNRESEHNLSPWRELALYHGMRRAAEMFPRVVNVCGHPAGFSYVFECSSLLNRATARAYDRSHNRVVRSEEFVMKYPLVRLATSAGVAARAVRPQWLQGRPGGSRPGAIAAGHRRARIRTLPEPDQTDHSHRAGRRSQGLAAGHETHGARRRAGDGLRQRTHASALAVHAAEWRRAGGGDQCTRASRGWQGHQGQGDAQDAGQGRRRRAIAQSHHAAARRQWRWRRRDAKRVPVRAEFALRHGADRQ